MNRILIKNARIIDTGVEIDRCGDIYIEDGIISAVTVNYSGETDKVIDATGLIAAPGLVDMHVHMRDPGFTYKDDIISVGEAAAAGGVTTVAAMPNTKPAADNNETIKFIVEKAKNSKVKVLPVGAITKSLNGVELTDFDSLKTAGAVALSDDGEPVSTAKLMFTAMTEASWLDLNILAHCEDKSLSEGGLINEGVISEMLGVKGVHSAAENAGVARELALARSSDSKVHICHVSTSAAVELIKSAKQNGVKVTAETCPHYFALNDELLLHQDADYRMNPPLRAEPDRRAIVRAVIDGTIDVIATDHAPHTVKEKQDFLEAPNGVVGLETSLAAGITYLVNTGYISLFKLIYMMSTVPAQILGINAGSLKVGSTADVVIFDPGEHWVVEPEKLHGNARNTPFKGLELCGKVKYTICRGELVFTDNN